MLFHGENLAKIGFHMHILHIDIYLYMIYYKYVGLYTNIYIYVYSHLKTKNISHEKLMVGILPFLRGRAIFRGCCMLNFRSVYIFYIYVYVRIYDFTCVLFHSGPRDKGQ